MPANHSTECVLQCNVTQECDFVQIIDVGPNYVICHLRGKTFLKVSKTIFHYQLYILCICLVELVPLFFCTPAYQSRPNTVAARVNR